MNTHKFRNIFGIASLLLSGSITAAQAENPGIYFGASVGSYNINYGNLDNNVRVLKTLHGLQFNNFFAVEAAWTDFNRVNNANDRFESDGQGVAAVLSLPVGIFVKGGQFWWSTDSVFSGLTHSTNGNDPFWGAGFRSGFSEQLALRLEVERYDVLSTHLSSINKGRQQI